MDSEENKLRRAEINKNGLKNFNSEWLYLKQFTWIFIYLYYVLEPNFHPGPLLGSDGICTLLIFALLVVNTSPLYYLRAWHR